MSIHLYLRNMSTCLCESFYNNNSIKRLCWLLVIMLMLHFSQVLLLHGCSVLPYCHHYVDYHHDGDGVGGGGGDV